MVSQCRNLNSKSCPSSQADDALWNSRAFRRDGVGSSKVRGWVGSQGEARAGQTVLARFMGREGRLCACLLRPAGWEESSTKEQQHPSELLSPERVPANPRPSSLCPEVSQLVPSLIPALLELLPLCWSLERVSLCPTLYVESLGLPQPFLNLRRNPRGCSKLDAIGLVFPCCGAGCGAQTARLSGGALEPSYPSHSVIAPG